VFVIESLDKVRKFSYY